MKQLLEANTSDSVAGNYLVIGQGDIGLKVTNALASNHKQITGLARKERHAYNLHEQAKYIQADALKVTAEQLKEFTHIAIVVTPDNYDAQSYKNTYLGIANHIASLESQLPKLRRVVFISSTGVYGQDKGEWIDETVLPTAGERETPKYILQAEQALQQAYGERTIIIRPSGIYGKRRLREVLKAEEPDKKALSRYEWTNRIMDSDLVEIIAQVLSFSDAKELKPIYLATDYSPVTSYELTKWLASKVGSTAPPVKFIEEVGNHLNNNYASGKRLHSNIPRDWLQFPDWQSGYSHILQLR